jgi:hypothetical protein
MARRYWPKETPPSAALGPTGVREPEESGTAHVAGRSWGAWGYEWGGRGPAMWPAPLPPGRGRLAGIQGGKPMTLGQALTGLTVLTVVGGAIAYLIVWLRSGAPWAVSRRNLTRGQSSSRDPIDDVW